jgi:hypothetical protein
MDLSARQQKAVPIPERGEKPSKPRQPLVARVGREPEPRFRIVGKDKNGNSVYAPVFSPELWR